MDIIKILASVLIGYAFGSVTFAVILSKRHHDADVRDMGSGNAGATNAARVFGIWMGVGTFVGDIAKTVCAMLLGRLIAGETGYLCAALFCIVGHCFPLFFGFRGGKGVSVGAAVALVLDWRLFLILMAVFFVSFIITHRVSVCSLLAAAVYPFAMLLLGYAGSAALWLGVFIAVFVLVMHHDNIRRLLAGEEEKFVPAKTKKK